MSKLSKYEQETIVNFTAADKDAEIYTADSNVMRKLDALVEKYPEYYRLICEDTGYSKTYGVASKKLISFRAPKILTDEQKEELAKRLNNRK